MRPVLKLAALLLSAFAVVACDPREATEVSLGETSLIVWVNPRVNEANEAEVPAPGTARSGITVRLGDVSATTDANGLSVLSPIPSGAQELTVEGGGQSGTISLQLVDKELRELAVALDDSGVQLMAAVPYRFGGTVIEVTPETPAAELATALNGSNQIVLLRGGEYTGDLDFNGSDVTLFGAGTSGGEVTVRGTVRVTGSANRIRGTRIVGALDVDGSSFGLTSSTVTGPVTIVGSSTVLIDNALCGGATLNGSGNVVLETAGLPPIAAPEEGC